MSSDSPSVSWVLTSSVFVWIMIPGNGLYYSGMAKRKNALSLLWLSLMSFGITSIQWFLLGYSLSFSRSGSIFIGNFAHIFMFNILNEPSMSNTNVPTIAFCFFQMMFAASAATVVSAATAERGRIMPTIIFTFLWCTCVYNFICYWIWSHNGWANLLGSLDYAGGVPIHIASGTSALAYSLILGKRHVISNIHHDKPHNINNVFIGTLLTWFGWFGFNGGSNLVVSIRTVLACMTTNLAACTGGLTWCIFDYFLLNPKYKFSLVGFCMGALSGLVCITPGAGFVNIPTSIIFGVCGSTCVYFGRKIKISLKIDDAFDIFAQHGIGGFTGTILTGIFAQKSIPALDSITISGGWLDGCWMQVVYQLAFAGAGFVWSFVVTTLILLIMNKIHGLSLRTTIPGEVEGIDYDQFNEYTHDYIELQRDLFDVAHAKSARSNELAVQTIDENINQHRQENHLALKNIKPIPTVNQNA